ncbi:MAG: isocitrate/isopropylmalate family dehydrogenase [Polyangia bacterium]
MTDPNPGRPFALQSPAPGAPTPAPRRRVAVIPGDGIGVEVVAQALRTLEPLGVALELRHFPWSADHYLATGETLPKGALEELRDHFDAIFFGAMGDPRLSEQVVARDVLLGLRFGLDLYINLRPVQLIDERLCPLKGKRCGDVDFVVLRENTEGPYVQAGGTFKRGTPDEIAITEDLNTRKGVERILRAGYTVAQALRGREPGKRPRLCMVDKANALPHAHGLWQRTHKELSREFSDVQSSHLYVDVAAMEFVRAPERFDVLVTSNLLGDILTDLGAAITGGLGLAASGNIHPGRCSLFEPVHGSAPDIAGKGVANPLAACLTLALLLDHLHEDAAAARLRAAVEHVVRAGEVTADLGGRCTTTQSTDAVLRAIEGGHGLAPRAPEDGRAR